MCDCHVNIVTKGVNTPASVPETNSHTRSIPRGQRQHACAMHLSSDNNKIQTTVSVSQRHVAANRIQEGVECCLTNSRNQIKERCSVCLYVSACQSVRLQAGEQQEGRKIVRIPEQDEEKRDKNSSVKQVYS